MGIKRGILRFAFFAPVDMDTSCPLNFQFVFQSPGTGDAELFMNIAVSQSGDNVYTTAGAAPSTFDSKRSLQQVVTIPAANTQQYLSIPIDMSDVIPRRSSGGPDIIWFTIARDATGGNSDDTLGSDVNVLQVTPIYTKWCDGAHV